MTKSILNNNPGNLIKGPKLFIGEKLVSTDTKFRQFYSIEWGYRAMFIELKNFVTLQYNTVRTIINRWATGSPKDEVNNYINFVEEKTGIDRNTTIDKSDKIQLVKIISAISHYINFEIPDEQDVLKGFDLIDREQFE